MFSLLFQHWTSHQWRRCWPESDRIFLWTVFIQRNPGQRHLQGLHLQPVSEEVIINLHCLWVDTSERGVMCELMCVLCVSSCVCCVFADLILSTERRIWALTLSQETCCLTHAAPHAICSSAAINRLVIITIKTTWQHCVWIQLQTQCVLCSLLPEERSHMEISGRNADILQHNQLTLTNCCISLFHLHN